MTIENRLIYDVGMHNGDDTAYYLHRGYNVVAIEANPVLCAGAAARFRQEIADGRLTLLNLGVAPVEGLLDFWICDGNSVWSSFDRTIAARDGLPHHRIPVECRRFSTILDQYGIPYYLKIDIEGNDHLCLEGLSNRADLPAYVSCELGNIEKYLQMLEGFGYTHYQLISQFDFRPLELRAGDPPDYTYVERFTGSQTLVGKLLRRGRRLLGRRLRNEWDFPLGSSGPFGEELPGRWQSASEALQTYNVLRDLFKRGAKTPYWSGKNYSLWVDLHARRGDEPQMDGNGCR
jgi:FkbM family methyltransferase